MAPLIWLPLLLGNIRFMSSLILDPLANMLSASLSLETHIFLSTLSGLPAHLPIVGIIRQLASSVLPRNAISSRMGSSIRTPTASHSPDLLVHPSSLVPPSSSRKGSGSMRCLGGSLLSTQRIPANSSLLVF